MVSKSEFVVVSNRLPVRRAGPKSSRWETSPGGLVSALTPVLRDRPSTWIGWDGTIGRAPRPFVHDGIRNDPVPLSQSEIETYYDGFSNRTIWPLYHDAVRSPEYHRHWWRPYVEVNRRFAERAAQRAARGGIVWVHDYQLQLVPGMLRQLRPDLRIGFFLHIPFPPPELFRQLPWRREILEGLLGADVVGFQTKAGIQNLSRLARHLLGSSGQSGELIHDRRRVQVGAFPISIDFERYSKRAADPESHARANELRTRLGQRHVLLGVDRLDYTKGIDTRLKAFRELLVSGRLGLDDAVFVQIGVPSRKRVDEYQQLTRSIHEIVGELNGEYGQVGLNAVEYFGRSFDFEDLVALYLAADVMIVTPLRDGMNLVAKEYIACRNDDTGVLVLSEFTGSARELRQALVVNPHDIDGLVGGIETALAMPTVEQKRRMRTLRRQVRQHDVYAWAQGFLDTLAE